MVHYTEAPKAPLHFTADTITIVRHVQAWATLWVTAQGVHMCMCRLRCLFWALLRCNGSTCVQALVSFVGDCTDTEVLHDVLELLCGLLAPGEPTQRPLLACLGDLGGVQLFMSLVQREQQPIRILGLRLIAAFVPFQLPGQPQIRPCITGL